MSANRENQQSLDFPLVSGGLANRIADRFGQSRANITRRLMRVTLLILVTWIPLLFLSMATGHALGANTDVPFLNDPLAHSRFLFVLPMLELAEAIVALSLIVQVRHFVESGVVPEKERSGFVSAITEVVRMASSTIADIAIAVLSLLLSVTMRLFVFSNVVSTWERQGATITLAGWWYILISLPVLFFFLIRWLWIFLLWSWFLFRVSRLDLALTATHPDHAGGLGFLGWGLASFSTVLIAISAVFSAGFAYEILHRSVSLDSLKYHIIIFVIIAIIFLHAPLLAFSGRLSRCRFTGLLNYSSLVLRHDRAFDEKWIEETHGKCGENLLGTADVQSLADIATAYDHVNDMWLLPVDSKAFVVLLASALLPMVPLLGTAIPLKDILLKLGELLV